MSLAGLMALTLGVGEMLPSKSLQLAIAQPQPVQAQSMQSPGAPVPGLQNSQVQGLPTLPPPGAPIMQTGAPAYQAPGAPNAQPGKTYPLDRPLSLVVEASHVYQTVQSYRCILISQEKVKGKLLPENVIELSYRKNPMSLYMKWLGPKDKVGQEVCYVQGRNQNMMRVHPVGGLGALAGWVSIEVNSPKVMENSRHVITETGFGNIIDQCFRSWSHERTLGKTVVNVAEYEYNKRRCTRVETVHPNDDVGYCYRSVVYFDNQTRLPVRMECYDRPRPGGSPGGELIECFSYVNVEFNVNLPEALFTH